MKTAALARGGRDRSAEGTKSTQPLSQAQVRNVAVSDIFQKAEPRKHPECDWLCGRRLADLPVIIELNGGRGCAECARWVCEAIEGPGALPFNPQRLWYRADPMQRFLKRLGRAAAKRGIDPRALMRAIDEASR